MPEDTMDQNDRFSRHFGPDSSILTEEARKKVDAGLWTTNVTKSPNFSGSSVVSLRVEDDPSGEGSLSFQALVATFPEYDKASFN